MYCAVSRRHNSTRGLLAARCVVMSAPRLSIATYNFWRCVKDRMREVHAASDCVLKPPCTTGKERRITRWEPEHVLEAVQKRLDQTRTPCAGVVRRPSIPSAH
jgi:hypothetical protein